MNLVKLLAIGCMFGFNIIAMENENNQEKYNFDLIGTRTKQNEENGQMPLNFTGLTNDVQGLVYQYLTQYIPRRRIAFPNSYPIDFGLSTCGKYLTTISYDYKDVKDFSFKLLELETGDVFAAAKQRYEKTKFIIDSVSLAGLRHNPELVNAIGGYLFKHGSEFFQEVLSNPKFENNHELLKRFIVGLVDKLLFTVVNGFRIQTIDLNSNDRVNHSALIDNLYKLIGTLKKEFDNSGSRNFINRARTAFNLRSLQKEILSNLNVIETLAPNLEVCKLKLILLHILRIYQRLEGSKGSKMMQAFVNFVNSKEKACSAAINICSFLCNLNFKSFDSIANLIFLIESLIEYPCLFETLFIENRNPINQFSLLRNNLYAVSFSGKSITNLLNDVISAINTKGFDALYDALDAQFKGKISGKISKEDAKKYYDDFLPTVQNYVKTSQNSHPEVWVIDGQNGGVIKKVGFDKEIQALSSTKSGLIAATSDSFFVYDLANDLIRKVGDNNKIIKQIRISSCGNYVILNSTQIANTTSIWDIATKSLLKSYIISPDGNVNNVKFSNDGKYLALADSSNILEIAENPGIIRFPDSKAILNAQLFNKLKKERR